MAVLKLDTPAALAGYVGKDIGTTDWVPVTQNEINLFADATGDHQWIHVDVERAKKESPFKGPIAHGYFTISKMPELIHKVLDVGGSKLTVNYGLNKVRFPAPVPVGKQIRAKVSVKAVKDLGQGNQEVEFTATVEVEGSEKPACVAEVVYRYYV
jgi:acyl dehydratase